MIEEWRPIEGWPYEVSSLGRVRRTKPSRQSGWLSHQVLSPALTKDGYLKFILADGMARRCHAHVHVQVCKAFHGPAPPGKPWARHLNGDPSVNEPWNLAWGSPLDNHDDMVRHGRRIRGERHHQAKLTQADVNTLRVEFSRVKGPNGRAPRGWQIKTAEALGVTTTLIRMILRGKVWIA